MKLSSKFKKTIKKRILTTFASFALVTLTLAVVKLTGISVPEKINDLIKQSDTSLLTDTTDEQSNMIQTTEVTIADDGAVVCDSIVQGVRDCNLEDGNYVFRINGKMGETEETKDYAVELINYYDDVTYSLGEGETTKTVSLGDNTTDHKMLVVKYHKNLTIGQGVTLTATNVSSLTYKKGMYICVMGELKNKGTITMTARGTYNQAGENVYLWKNIDNSFEYIPAVGGAGGASRTYSWRSSSSADYQIAGIAGSNGTNRRTGGGGSGGLYARRYDYSSGNRTSGSGAAGTSYSGGSGGGGINTNYGGTLAAGNAAVNGGAGGAGYSYRGNTSWGARIAGGGAGNIGGVGKSTASGSKLGSNNASYSGQNGTGGLLVVYTDNLYNIGTISSNGSVGGNALAGGGSSGGGSINIFANNISASGNKTVTGGVAAGGTKGGAGGTGSITVTKLKADLNYEEKSLELKIGNNYYLDKNKLSYLDQNGIQSNLLTLGNISYESLDKSIATIDSDGKITAIAEGSTKVKITDTTNNTSTYVYLDVVNNVKVDVQEGKNFTIALKQNGTVWSYGINTSGQLGIGNNDNKNEPTQISTLSNVKEISTGYSHAVALLENGEVYSWGQGTSGQLGNGTEENSLVPVKVEGISNIVKVDSYKNMSIALSNDGKVYVWGEGYSTLPMRVVFAEKVIDISGTLMLTTKGEVYNISDTTKAISNFNSIAKISCGEAHNLALSTNGVVYSWGENTYGECGVANETIVVSKEISYSISDISAGNCTSILKADDGKVYVLGNNSNGQIGLSTTAKATSMTQIDIGKEIESISAGEGTHSSLIAEDGFVWNTGLNTYGELGTGDNTNKTAYSQIGETVLKTDSDLIYLDINESTTIKATLENTFNLKIDLIDDDQDNFKITLSDNKNLLLDNKTITGLDYCNAIATVSHITGKATKDIKINVVIKMESIVQGFKDINLADGQYTVVVQNQAYLVELINYYNDMVYSENTELGDSSTEYKTLVVKYHGNLTINSGVTVTAKTVNNLTYKKGMYLCVMGNLKNNGTITMTARGTYNQAGENVYLWKNINNTYEYVPETGAAGGESVYYRNTKISSYDYYAAGISGKSGINRATGGGGSGAIYARRADFASFIRTSGAGAAGTSYSGGSAGGGIDTNYSGTYAAGNAAANGGAGGNAFAARKSSSWAARYAGGGAGNTAGIGKYTASGTTVAGNNTSYSGKNGTGGLLILYADTLYNNGTISSNGSLGGSGRAGGGSSGGGSINIFARIITENGTQIANGGTATGGTKGGAGGNGSVTVNELGSVLNYSKKSINLNVQDTYEIEKAKLSYTKLNDIQTEDLSIGNLEYESLDTNIATVDKTGKITANKVGKTKIKITDLANGYSTYIIINVNNGDLVTPQIKEGTDFTIALKANGTVWSWGKNTNGQLGNNKTENSNEPVKVIKEDLQQLTDVVDIAAGDNNAIALNKNGEVYTWGIYDYLDETGMAQSKDILTATKEETLSNIVKVNCYKNNFYAVDSNGVAYIWGEGYANPTKINTAVGIVNVSGNLLLGEDGKVYYTSDPNTSINYLNNICEISCGEDHYLFLTMDGYVYSLGNGDLGQLGNGTYSKNLTPSLVTKESGYLDNVASISAGNKTSIALTYDGKVYAWGDNTNKKIGITDTKTAYATEVTALQDKEGNSIELKKMEVVETGTNHSTISDINGFVYTVGLNTEGELGTGDNNNREIFTKIGNIEILSIPDEINVSVDKTKDVSIMLGNTFNIKRDVVEDGSIKLNNTNSKEITVEEIEGIDNSQVTNAQNFIPNYKITGNKIGRVNLVATSEGYSKNIWINVVNSEDDKVSAKVVNGKGFTVALRSDGSVWSYGNNTKGQLGLGDTNLRNKPEKIQVAEEIIDISSGENHTLLLGKSGKVYSFGINANGQLGTGNTTVYKAPTELKLENIEKVVASSNTSFAINKEGQVYAWGEGYTKIPTLLTIKQNVIDISKSYYLSDDGIVRRIKDNAEIKLSLNEYAQSEEPVCVEEKVMQMSEGQDHLLLLGESGKIYSYGINTYGQLGDKTTLSRENLITTVVRVENGNILENISEISAGDKYSVVVTQDGKVYTFGINGEEQLGISNNLENGGMLESGYAILKEDISNLERVSAGYIHTSVYKEDGNIYAWGQGIEGELGNGANSNYWEAQRVGKNIVETNTNEILLEEEQTFDINSWIEYFNLFKEKESEITYEILDQNLGLINNQTGEIMAMSPGRTTVIAKEVGTDNIAVIPLRILEKGTKPKDMTQLIEPQVETAGSHTIMLKTDGTVWCYGIGKFGELGNGKETTSDEPVQAVFPNGTIITKIAAGENHSIALDNKGNVWTWGRNNYYQLGNINDNNVLVPTQVNGISNIKDIEAGTYTSFAIGEAGEVYSWGLNANGEGGVGNYTNKISSPTKAKFVTDAIDIKAGKNHTVILKSTGEVLVTGSNLYGELGTNSSLRKTNQFTKVENLNNVVAISAGDSNNTVIKIDGTLYSWGSNIYKELGTDNNDTVVGNPTKVQNLKDICYIDGGKGYNLAIDSNNQVFVNGLNSSGELGNNSKTNVNSYTKLTTIDNVIQLSAGNAYTTMLRADGTVWGCGDYTHGDETVKSKTKSTIPVQVGNDQTGLSDTEITISINETKEIAANCSYEFNLIHLDENFTENLSYSSLNEQIATVDSDGIVKGIKVGTTRVNTISKLDGKIYSVLVKVVSEKGQFAPKVEAGEDYAAILKSDGSLWTFGYNADGRLGTGNNLTKEIPVKTNILSTYKDVKTGKDFIIALRDDGTVWSTGNNKEGQLGNGTTTSKNKLSQIQGLEDIEKICAGENFAIAEDSYGIVYKWGNGELKPTVLQTNSQRIIDISAGKNQSVFVTAKGTVFGDGSILNTTIAGLENAIKAQVTSDSIIILTADNKVFEYKNGNLVQIQVPDKVIDISATNNTVMYQTANEKTYVSGENTYGELGTGTTNNVTTPVVVNLHGENTFGIGVGYKNTYIIENNGNVYAAGNNEFGSIGNGTRTSTQEHVLVGDRTFSAKPETKTMNVGDTEEIKIEGQPFNVFGNQTISNDEYTWTLDEENVIDLNKGSLTAKAEGTAHITVTDKVTGENITLTRIVVEPDSDRIAKITVNKENAELDGTSTAENITYKVQVVTNDNTGNLTITTNNSTDRISIDGGTTWSYNGILNQEIDIENKTIEIPIIVGVQNNNGEYPVELNYTLIVEKITDDISVKKVTVTSQNSEGNEDVLTATPVGLTRYEVAVEEGTTISLVDVLANSKYSSISIDGLEYELQEQKKNIVIENELTKEVKFAVKSEAGTEVEYTLVIYKKNEIMNLASLKVNNEEATKVSEGVYAATVSKDTKIADIVATVDNNLASISIANNTYTVKTNTESINVESDTTVVTIRVKVDEEIKEYTLYIYRRQENNVTPKLNMLMVNSTVIEPEEDGLTYIAYVPSSETEATIRAIAKDTTTKVKIAEFDEEMADSQKTVQVSNNENTYKIKLTGEDESTIEYTVIIKKAESDASIDKIYVSNGDTDIDAKLQDDGSYMVKIPSDYKNVNVTAISRYAKSKVQVADTGNYLIHKDTQNVITENEKTIVKVKVQSEDKSNEIEYTLNIVKMSNNAKLAKVEVDGTEATLGTDGNYHYTLLDAKNNVSVKAITDAVDPTEAWVKIDNTEYALYEITKQVDITAKQTEAAIKVKAEDGTIQEYKLIIEGLPDDTNIQKVTVNGKEATYVEEKSRYEIRSEDTQFNVEVTLSDMLASMILGDNSKAIGKDSITVNKEGSETIVKVVVTSQNGLEQEEYIIAILEKSNNANLDILKVNNLTINPDSNGNYKATVKNATTNIKVEAIAEDTFANTTINGGENNSYIASLTENIVDGKTIYNHVIKVVAEDGTIKEYNLEVEQLEANTNITKVKVGKEEITLEDAILQEDGNYYYKIDRVDSGYISVELESEKSTVSINGEIGTVVKAELPDEKNTIKIEVKAEDETTKIYTLIIEKLSNDTTIKSITGNKVVETDIQDDTAYVYVDEDESSVDLTITLTNVFASLKLKDETDYEENNITRTVSSLNDGNTTVELNIKAEDGTEREYTISICKKSNLNLDSVVINSETLTYDEENERYFKLVSYGNEPKIVITPSNISQTVQLLDERGNVLATSTGVLTTTQKLGTADLTTKYIIKVISHNGENIGSQEYELWIRQKSQETGLTYIKVDSLGTTLSDDKLTYSSTVSGKDEYPVEIKSKDEKALIRIEDTQGNILINNQTGILTGKLAVEDGETKEFKVIVTSENGEEKEYTLRVERISSNLEIDNISVTDYDTDESTIITRNVVNYDPNTKTYKIIVNRNLKESKITINAKSSFTDIVGDNTYNGKGTLEFNKQLNGLGINEIKIDLTAADGSKDTKYLQIIQLSDEIGIQNVYVDGVEILQKEDGNYETTVTDEKNLSEIKVVLPVDTSKVSINKEKEVLKESTVNVSKDGNRQLLIPIKVTAEDGTNYTYTLTLNIISHDTSVETVNVNDIKCNLVDGKYITYFDRNATELNVEVIAGVKYSTISHIMEDNTEISNIEKLNFTMQTSDLSQEIYETTFKVKAEDGTEKEYILNCIRNSDDNSINGVYVNNTKLEPLSNHPKYANGTYYIAVTENNKKVDVKVESTNEFATVSFAETSAIKVLEKTITLDTENKVTEVPVTITSQQGNSISTVIYIEKISDNNNLASVKVNSELAEKDEEKNSYTSYIYDTLTSAKVEITAENSEANIIRTTSTGETYLDENGLSYQGKGNIAFDINTLEQKTTIYFKIVAENGTESEVYTLQIEKMSTDANLKEIYVEGTLIQPNEEGKYVANVIDTVEKPVVKTVTNHKLAYVRIALEDEELNISEKTITMSNSKQTIIPITVRSQSGITKVTYLYINKISTSVELSTVTLNDKEADLYNEDTCTYRFLIEPNETDLELFVLAQNDYTILEYEGTEYEASLRTILSLDVSEQGKTLKIKSKSESGIEKIYNIEIARKSDNVNLEYLKVNDIVRNPDTIGGDTYTIIIPQLATSASIEVKTEYKYATIRIGDNQIATSQDKGVLDCSDLTQSRIVIPVVVTAADGTTIKTYNVILLRGSNDIQIELKVNNNIVTQDSKGDYVTKLPETIENIDILATALNEGITGIYSSIDINETGIYETPSKEIVLSKENYEGKEQIEIPIKVTAEDGTLRENVLTIKFIKGTYISGKIATENINEEYISTVTVYKTSDTRKIGDELNPREEIAKVDTNPDGTFKVLVYMKNENITDNNANGIADELEETYDIVVTKDGYLDYIVTNIEVQDGEETTLDYYKLIAGDVIKTGEIELDDLVSMNNNYGVTTEENKIYDLNEDGKINSLDRNILKKNYGKKVQTIKWINPNAIATTSVNTLTRAITTKQDFILPIACKYTITSEYGTRKHPTTGIVKKHTGIDLAGTWHTEILSIADGEVTFAGVQNGFGNCVEIKHIVNGETIYSFYAHLSKINVQVGNKIKQGQTIGLEGGNPESDPNPGNSTGHHLHFEIRKASGYGNDVDPNSYINF